MMDKGPCVGTYGTDLKVQTNPGDIVVNMSDRGGVKAVTLRFGDAAAGPPRLASDMERRLSAIDLSGKEFARAAAAPRVRMKISTVLGSAFFQELDMTGFAGIQRFMSEDPTCR